MVDVVSASSSISVLGGPSSIRVDLDLGSPGQRGSQIFTGPGAPTDPAIQATVFANNPAMTNDLYINLSPFSPDYLYLYKYESINAVLQWSKILRLIPNAVITNPAVKFINGIAHTVVTDATTNLPVIIKGLYFPLSAFLETVDLGNLSPKDFNIQHDVLSNEEVSSGFNIGTISASHTVQIYNPLTSSYEDPETFPFGVQTLSATLVANENVSGTITPITGYRIVHFVATIGGRSTLILDFDATAVNSTLNTITIADHGLTSGSYVAYMNNNNSSIGGLTNELEYAVVSLDDDTIQLLKTGSSFNAATAIDFTTNRITATSHSYTTGDLVLYQNNGNANIGGLTNNLPYFVVVVDPNTISLSADGVSIIDLTNGATGIHSLPEFVDFTAGATGTHSLVTFPEVG